MVSRVKRTDYGLVSCQYERDVIAGIDRKWERERAVFCGRKGVNPMNRRKAGDSIQIRGVQRTGMWHRKEDKEC